MKKFAALIALALVLVGVRLYDTGLSRHIDGELTVFSQISEDNFFPSGTDVYRIDLEKGADIDEIINKIGATIVFKEDCGRVIYAYCPMVTACEWLNGQRINVMIYDGKDSVVVGVPIIKGCY